MKTLTRPQILWMVQTAILAAIIIVLAFTPLGYLKYGALSITFLTIPVVIGAIVVGPLCGATLGLVFGATSFIQCFGADLFGAALLSINPFYTFILCFVPRILMGWLVGLIFMALAKPDGTRRFWSFIIASLSGALINTILFLGTLVLFFGETTVTIGDVSFKVVTIIGITLAINASVEAAVTMVAGGAITKALRVAFKKGPAAA
jgi:uncharacterized membrane protein